jgi:hypothetical protein
MVFNVEMRLDVATVKGRWANVRLLISPMIPIISPRSIIFLVDFDSRLAATSFPVRGRI